jgi:hypothetical protein
MDTADHEEHRAQSVVGFHILLAAASGNGND